jgi:hypothetical protein
MAKSTAADPAASADFETAMKNIVTVTAGLGKIESTCRNISNLAGSIRLDIENAIHGYKTPTRESLEAALKVNEEFDELATTLRTASDTTYMSLNLLIGNLLREPNGELVDHTEASENATSEAIV